MANSKRNLDLDGHTKRCTSVNFSPNNNVIVSGSYDNLIKLWYPGTATKTKTIKGHTAAVRSVSFSPDENLILSSSDDKSVKLWDVNTLKFKSSYIGHTNWVTTS